MVGVFITIVSLIAALYFIQLGVRRGAFPVLLTVLVTLLAFLIAMNFGASTAVLLRKWMKFDRPENAFALGYLSIWFIFFCLFGYLAMRFSPEIAPMYPKLDKIGGGVLGAVAGLLLTGSLGTAWFTSSLAARFPVPKGGFYFKPHIYLLYTYGYITGKPDAAGGQKHFARFPGGVWFNPESTIKTWVGKGSAMPRGGDGFWVTSVPQGMRVFVSTVRAEPQSSFENKLGAWIPQDWPIAVKDNTSTIQGFVGKTPVYVRSDSPEAWVAVETDLPKSVTAPSPGENPLVDDGQNGVYYYAAQRKICKYYRLRKPSRDASVVNLIALLYPKNASLAEIDSLLPSSSLVDMPPDKRSGAQAELTAQGLSQSEAEQLVKQLERGGKIIFRPKTGEPRAMVITNADGNYEAQDIRQGY